MSSTLALILAQENGKLVLYDTLFEDTDIETLSQAVERNHPAPLQAVYDAKYQKQQHDEMQENDIEELLCRPVVDLYIKEQAIEWFQSRQKIDECNASEAAAAKIIADYAFHMVEKDPERTDFTLVSRQSQVRILVYKLS